MVKRRCFGKYGKTDLEKIFNKRKVLWCTMMCEYFPLCKECYWIIWELKKFKRVNEDMMIYKFMKENKLRFVPFQRWQKKN